MILNKSSKVLENLLKMKRMVNKRLCSPVLTMLEWKAIVYYSLVIIRDIRFGAELLYGWGKIGLQSWHKISLWGLACFKVVWMDVPETSHFSTTGRGEVSRKMVLQYKDTL